MKLTGPDFFEWMGLRRVRRGGLTRREGHYYNHGNPVPGWLIPDIINGLLKDGLLELGDPDKSGMRRVARLPDSGHGAADRCACGGGSACGTGCHHVGGS
jgi:hypothetical protein